MLTRLKHSWTQLRRSPPGERFRRHYEARHARGAASSTLRRVILFAIAAVLLAIGVVLMFIPGPAILFFIIAGALLAEESRFVARALDASEVRLRRLWKKVWPWWQRLPLWAKIALAALGGAAAVAFGWLGFRWLR
ncbi:MAG TPA: PGPGW domain-containing protein [Candidatus Synoicihabitans sp.]|nr:PGPGW domain-containing protein [Candidatus Synoicihabitans sp.]